jgi:nitrogen fixation NifU-like protein
MKEKPNSLFEQILDAAEARPKNMGSLRDANAHAKVTGPCGDTVEMWLRIDGGRIRKAMFMTDGCEPSIACSSAAAKLVEGMKPEQAQKLTQTEVLEAAGAIPPDHHHCASLAAGTIESAIIDWIEQPAKKPFIEKLKTKLNRRFNR